MRGLPSLLPNVVVLVVAGVLVAHDATWSVVVGGLLAALAVLRAGAVARGRFGTVVACVAAAAVFGGAAAVVSDAWLDVVGRTGPASVTGVHAYTPSRSDHLVDDDTLALGDGTEIAGPLRNLRHGSLQVGDTVSVRYDPTGVIRFPTLQGSDRHYFSGVFGGLTALLGGLAVLGFLQVRRYAADGRAPSTASIPRQTSAREATLQRRLLTEARQRADPDGRR